MTLIIDCHGHQTLVPKAHLEFRAEQLKRLQNPKHPRPILPSYDDSELTEIIVNNQLKLQQERGADITIFSPRASVMEPHIGDSETSVDWARACNNMIKRTIDLFPNNFVGVCQLPQQVKNSRPVGLEDAIEELERCVLELGFVGCNLNPDPFRWALFRSTSYRSLLVPSLRENGRAKSASNDPRIRLLQRMPTCNRFLLYGRRYKRLYELNYG